MGVAGINARAQTNFSIYSDELDNAYQDWSWGTHNLANTTPVHSGANSVAFSGDVWQAISFWHQDFDPTPYTNLTFWANGGSGGGQVLQVFVQYGTNTGQAYPLPALTANTWRQFTIPFAALGIASQKCEPALLAIDFIRHRQRILPG